MSISLTGKDPFGEAAARREAVYFWMGCLAIGTIAVGALTLGAYLRRQMKLTRLKNDLIATVSHELKTPLASMRVLVDTLLAGRVAGAPEQREYLGLIGRENMRLSRLIDNFLTFSRMERQKTAFHFAPVDVAGIVNHAVEAMGERGAGVRVCVPEGLSMWGDADALVTVVVNLLDNAWKYSGEEKRIVVRAKEEKNEVVLEVEDNGVGIARRHWRRVFKRFYQVDQRLSRAGGGCGLGLAIVDYIVREHDGRVEVKSEVAKGSVFTVWIKGSCAKGAKEPCMVGSNGHA
jgi:signal transduction histidine kinase